MVHDVLDKWMPKYGNKLNIIKRLLEKKYTFKWAFCVGTAQYNDKINKNMQDILRNVYALYYKVPCLTWNFVFSYFARYQ